VVEVPFLGDLQSEVMETRLEDGFNEDILDAALIYDAGKGEHVGSLAAPRRWRTPLLIG